MRPLPGGFPGRPIPVTDVGGVVRLASDRPVYAGRHVHDAGYPVHEHDFLEITLVLAGAGIQQTETGRSLLSVGDVAVLKPGVRHGFIDCSRLRLFNICVGAELLGNELAWARSDPWLGHLLTPDRHGENARGVLSAHLDGPALSDCIDQLDALAHAPWDARAELRGDIVAHLLLALGHVARAVRNTPLESSSAGEAGRRLHPVVADVLELLDTAPAQAWTVPALAERVHLSAAHLARLFTASVGCPPMTYLSRRRAANAAQLLVQTRMNVAQIGRVVGWPEPNYFARRFRAHYGVSPSEYRRRFGSPAVPGAPPAQGGPLDPRVERAALRPSDL